MSIVQAAMEGWGSALRWIKASRAHLALATLCAALVVIALIPMVITWAPNWLASTGGLNATQRATEVGSVRTALLALLAGAVAVVGAIYTARTFSLNRKGHELDRQGQITERFTRAVDQIGSEKLDVRLGGIYALERLARESRADHGPIMEILTAYVREHARQPTRAEKPSADTVDASASPDAADEVIARINSFPTDVQAVLTVLGRRTRAYDTGPLDLRTVDLTNANLHKADLSRANLFRAKLQGTILFNADLIGVNLVAANLSGAGLQEANLFAAELQWANLHRANLQEATLHDADLHEATLTRSNLRKAKLNKANLEGADLQGANLQDASLEAANLQRAILDGANLTGANLQSANLQSANLRGAKLQDARLDGANLQYAGLDEAVLQRARSEGANL